MCVENMQVTWQVSWCVCEMRLLVKVLHVRVTSLALPGFRMGGSAGHALSSVCALV